MLIQSLTDAYIIPVMAYKKTQTVVLQVMKEIFEDKVQLIDHLVPQKNSYKIQAKDFMKLQKQPL